MKNGLFLLVFFVGSFKFYGQNTDLHEQMILLEHMGSEAFGCNSPYWKIIKKKKLAIPYLIDQLADTSVVAATYHCKHGVLRVGDLAYLMLTEIIYLPESVITKHQFDVQDGDCWVGLFNYIEKNRVFFKNEVAKWYSNNKQNLHWKRYGKRYINGCRKTNGIKGYYTIY